MKTVLFLTPYYYPDLGPSAPVFTGICTEISKDCNFKVICLTARPHYNENVRLKYKKSIFSKIESGVRIVRVNMLSGRQNTGAKKIIHQLNFNIASFLRILTLKYDVAVVDGPFTWALLSILYIKYVARKKYIYNQHDIYPDVAAALGYMKKNSTLFKMWDLIEFFVYKNSSYVTVINKSAAGILIAKGVEANKVKTFPIPSPVMLKNETLTDYRKKWGLEGKKVILYAGNIGRSQRIMELASIANDIFYNVSDQLVFLIVGDGDNKQNLIKYIKNNNIKNILVKDFVPNEDLYSLYKSFDWGFVPIDSNISNELIPSKAISMMSGGLPLILWGAKNSELAVNIRDYMLGYVFDAETEDFQTRLLEVIGLSAAEKVILSKNIEEYLAKFDLANVSQTLKDLLHEIC